MTTRPFEDTRDVAPSYLSSLGCLATILGVLAFWTLVGWVLS